MNEQFEARSREYRAFIEDYMKGHYQQYADKPQKPLYDAMQYSLLAGGKRLRPILVFEFARMCGGDWKQAAPFAAAIEMIHTYSLIHDDLPCMDNDDYRRGRLTNHKVFGEGMAVLAGDALLTDAFAVASQTKMANPEKMGTAIGVLGQCAGSDGMVGGQVLDIMSEQRQCTEQEIMDIQVRKTCMLIRAACLLGVLAAGGSEEQLDAAATFATAMGLAFQIRDDMLDVIGSAQELGKGVGTDTAKNTAVRLHGLEKCDALVKNYTKTAIDALAAFQNADYIIALTNSMVDRRV